MIRLVCLGALCAIASGCYAFALPPSRGDIGSTVHNPGTGPSAGLRVSAGVHSASAQAKSVARTDIGAGYVFEGTEASVDAMPESAGSPATMSHAHGTYVELSRAVSMARNHRAWLGLRSELLWHDTDRRSLGVSSRLSWELFSKGRGEGSRDTRCGFVAGSWTGTSAFGAFIETGARMVEGAPSELVATAGLSIRLPVLVGIGMDVCSVLR